MKTTLGIAALSSLLVLAPSLSRAQEEDQWPGYDQGQAGAGANEGGQPFVTQAEPPAPPPSNPVYPAEAVGASPAAAPAPQGQWVSTEQYGWVWMPYGNAYTYVPVNGGVPNMYVYYPSVGWSWVIAPWIWGWGPVPYFGAAGCAHYGWWGHGYGHWYGFRGGYASYYGRGYWNGGHWYGSRSMTPARPVGGGVSRGVAGWSGHGVPSRPGGAWHGQALPHGGSMPRFTPPAPSRGGFGGQSSFRGASPGHSGHSGGSRGGGSTGGHGGRQR